jgi:hypothetical protein
MEGQPGALTLGEEDRRALAVWAADCAERVLPLFERAAPSDPRPRAAIDGLRAFARGELGIGPARALAVSAHAAARDVATPAATAAARAAGHAAATAHMASHARGVPAYASIAAALAGPDDPTAAANEVAWAIRHASPEVRAILRSLPAPPKSAGALGNAIKRLHESMVAGD